MYTLPQQRSTFAFVFRLKAGSRSPAWLMQLELGMFLPAFFVAATTLLPLATATHARSPAYGVGFSLGHRYG
jgi:hypothetical protein